MFRQKHRCVVLTSVSILLIFSLANLQSDYGVSDESGSDITEVKEPPEYKIHIVTLADKAAKKAYRLQLETIRCYVEANGYNLIIPSDDLMKDEDCQARGKKDIMHVRHCVFAKMMEGYSEHDYFFVMDADSIAFDLNRKLPMTDIYLKHDITFFERWWSGEVTVAYAIKNNPKVREFLLTWSMEKDQPYKPPAKYYSSSDNGILHVLLMKWFILGLKRVSSMEEIANRTWPEQKQNVAQECVNKFANLNTPVTDLGPYFSFIMCARVALGMQGSGEKFSAYGTPKDDYILKKFRDKGVDMESQGLSLKIMPRFNGFAMDENAKDKASKNVAFFHGYKNDKGVLEVWKDTFNATSNSTSIYPLCQTYSLKWMKKL